MASLSKPTSKQVDAAIPAISSPQHEAYFFARLENPQWIAPLAERGIFKNPPKAQDVKGGGIRFPVWPASQYLARMALHEPAQVAALFAAMNTDNASVMRDLIRAALAMPVDNATSLVGQIVGFLRDGYDWGLFESATDLSIRLAESGKLAEALRLADQLFAPTSNDDKDAPGRREIYQVIEGLSRVVPVFSKLAAGEFLPRLADWLSISIESGEYLDRESGSDRSYWWRPAVEEHDQNDDDKLLSRRVGFAREGFEVAIQSGTTTLQDALSLLGKYKYLIFKRLRLHLVTEFAEQASDLVQQLVLDKTLFDDFEYKHEYAMLLTRRFGMLSTQQQRTWFAWVDAGPDMSDFDDSVKERLGRPPTDLEREDRKRYWQYEKIHLVRSYLVEERKVFHAQMLDKYGEPELADMNVFSSTRWGDDSALTTDQLSALSFSDAVKQVASWKPDSRDVRRRPTIEGLASVFKRYVATQPVTFSEQACLLIGKPAIFVRGFLNEMTQAVKNGSGIDVPAVIDLCLWVMEQPLEQRTIIAQEHERLADVNWQWTRDQIAEFVQEVCKSRGESGPRYVGSAIAKAIWTLIDGLYRGNPSSYIVRDTSDDDPRVHDYLDLGMNSPRGKATEAGLDYARWMANQIKIKEGENEIVPDGFFAMPEVQEMLEWQITPGNRTIEALAIIGSRIGLLYWIDKEWLARNSDRLFHLEGLEASPKDAFGWAAWNAFLVWVPPHIEFFKLFRRQFQYGVAQAAKLLLPQRPDRSPIHHLGEHLVVLFARGQILLEPEDLLHTFVSTAIPESRRHVIEFVGQLLNDSSRMPEETVKRFMTLWDLYWSTSGKADTKEAPAASTFGRWFSSPSLPSQWAIDRLRDFVEVTATPEPDDMVVERLAEIGHVDPAKAIQILDRLVRGDQEGWRIHGWAESAKEILRQSMKASEDVRKQATDLISYLGRRGFSEFGTLRKS